MDNEFIIETNNLRKSFGNKEILKGISLHVPKGSIYALLGPNGAGKTTTIRILTGILKPTSGEVTVQGIDVKKDADKIRAEIGILSQLSAGYKDFKTQDNIVRAPSCSASSSISGLSSITTTLVGSTLEW